MRMGTSVRLLDPRPRSLPTSIFLVAAFALAASVLADSGPWTPIGPFGQNASVRALAVDPSNPSTIYAGVVDGATDLGGVFKSVDGGNSWARTALPQAYETAIFALAVSSSSPSILYAGGKAAMFKSNDAGETWQTVFESGITAIAIDTSSSSTVCVTVGNGFLFRTIDDGTNWFGIGIGFPAIDVVADPTSPHTFYLAADAYPGAVVLKSTDGGAGWPVSSNGIEAAHAQKVFVAPTQPATVFASMSSGVFRSTNGGASWTPVGPGLPSSGVTAFAASPRSPSTVYAATSDGLFRSSDAGLSWTRLGVSETVRSLAVDPESGNTVFAGTDASGVLRSQDSGTSWSASNQGLFASTGVTALAADPLVPFSLYASTSPGGLFKSTDRGATWAAPGAGLGAAEMKAIVLDPSAAGVAYALDDRHVYKTTDGGEHWIVSYLWNVYCYCSTSLTALAIDPTVPSTLYVAWTTISHSFIGDGGILKSTDGGGSWTSPTWPFANTPVPALTVDRNSTIYAPGARSEDGGASWQALGGPCTNLYSGHVEIAAAPDATLYMTCDPDFVDVPQPAHRSTDGGMTWTDLAVAGSHVVVAPTDSQLVYVAGSGGVFRSTNSGATWTDESAGLPDPKTTALALDPRAPSRVYVGNAEGVFTKDFSGAAEPFCAPSPTTLCLAGNRFKAEVEWSVPSDGRSGHGMVRPLTGDTGAFWFFSADNLELVLKVLDGRSLNGAFWIFYGALSDVQYTITVTDMQTGAVRTYENPSGHLASHADTSAFPQSAPARASVRSARAIERATAAELYAMYGALAPARARAKTAPPDSTAGSGTLCLEDSRFRVSVAWEVPAQGRSGDGVAVPLTGDTGYFWFFDDANVELMVKVLDADATNGHHWVFYGALSNVKYTITVTDTQTGAIRTYDNASGELASVADTTAF